MLNRITRYASLLFAAVMLISCGKEGGVTKKTLEISVDKKFVQTFGGDYINLTVTLGGEKITQDVTFFDENDEVLLIDDFKYMTEVPGEHEISAAYGTYFSEPVKVTAIAVAIPETPEDEHPERTDFRPRVLLTQFTTTGCTWCPSMKHVLKNALNDSYADKVVKVDCHASTMSRNDPAYVDLKDFEEQCNGRLPSVNLDLAETTGYLQGMTGADMQGFIDVWFEFKSDNAAGIAVNSVATDDQIVAKVSVKAAQTGNYRVGLMLLEDNIVATSSQTQLGSGAEDWMNTHNSCVRYMDARDGKYYYGHQLGQIAKGESEDYVFILDLESIWDRGSLKAEQNGCTWSPRWVNEELHLAVFVTTSAAVDKNEILYVSNVIDCPINGVTPFEYR